MKKTKKTCCGRSMVEMLSVLAVIGILSIGGLVAYALAERHHRANEILNDVRMLGGNVMFRDKNYALNTEIEPEDFQKTIANDMKAYQRTNELFGVVVSDVDAETCRLTLHKADGAYQMRVSQNGEGWSEWNGNTDICGDGTQAVAMEFLFNAQPAHDFAPGDDDSDDDDDPKTNTISCLNADESEACCLKDHPNYAYVNGKCVDKGCQECYSWNGSSCVFDEKAITAEHVNACLRCDVTGLVSISGRDESYAECYSCLNGTWKQNATNTQRCCEFWGMDWNDSANQCCPSGTKYAPKSKACCAVDSGFEIVEGECVEKCDGHRHPLSEGGERVGWGCCPDSKWAANHFSQNEGKCCDSEEVVSNGHCCQEGFEWDGEKCALPCPAERLIAETGECCAEGTKAVNGVCCASDTDSEVCCAGMHAAEGEYTLRTYSTYKFCVPKCGECQKFQYANPTTETRAKACVADVSSETCCVKAGREWAAKESSGKQCCDGTVYNGLCYNKISGGLCRTGKSVPHCSEDLPRGTICQAASYNDSSRKREVSISTGGRGAGTRVFKCMQYTADAECKAYGATLIDSATAQAAYGCYNMTGCKVTNYKYSCTQDHSNHYVLMGDGHMERENSGRTSCWWACNCEALCVKN